jgi:pimeloyl-ACP methyl ester carboxylesterase
MPARDIAAAAWWRWRRTSSSSRSASIPSGRRRHFRDHRSAGEARPAYHRDARKTFYAGPTCGSTRAFERWDIRDEYLPGVRCPVLAIQGYDDEYGTMAQLDEIARRVPVRASC